MPKKTDFIKASQMKNYLLKNLNIRSSHKAIDLIEGRFNELIREVLKESTTAAVENKRKTIMDGNAEKAQEPGHYHHRVDTLYG